jgi:hypothetical protein
MSLGGQGKERMYREKIEYGGEHANKGLEIGVGMDFANGRITGRGHWPCCWWCVVVVSLIGRVDMI